MEGWVGGVERSRGVGLDGGWMGRVGRGIVDLEWLGGGIGLVVCIVGFMVEGMMVKKSGKDLKEGGR